MLRNAPIRPPRDMPVPVHGMMGMHVDRGGWIHFAGGATEPAIGGMSRIHQVRVALRLAGWQSTLRD
jgi:hypothetical protein